MKMFIWTYEDLFVGLLKMFLLDFLKRFCWTFENIFVGLSKMFILIAFG